ncbi:hypothetical protein BUALT_Bualt07G0125700 [Buddleja alternifolia]|uniref:EF-hand domain-containing protein n=1 Tax=Buddleja alternifolia TaxID=168488 RepID=A0AAV6XID8_9LAMI|nr:hypothetical protein BUALT_Bualt07G0125700 [Buddleja alternifolia]
MRESSREVPDDLDPIPSRTTRDHEGDVQDEQNDTTDDKPVDDQVPHIQTDDPVPPPEATVRRQTLTMGSASSMLTQYDIEEVQQHSYHLFIFKVYDSDCNGKVTFNDLIEVLRDLTGSFMSNKQREEVLSQLMREAGYTRESSLLLDDFIKILRHSGLKMEVEIPVD